MDIILMLPIENTLKHIYAKNVLQMVKFEI